MKLIFGQGDLKVHRFKVREEDLASFDAGLVHPVCSTFTLAREVEWAGRLFVLEMCEPHEEGIGTMLHIQHKSPAFIEEEVEIKAFYGELKHGELTCKVKVYVGNRLIATGMTGQKIMSREKINQIFTSLDR